MTSAPGTKKKSAASIQRLMEDVPLCAGGGDPARAEDGGDVEEQHIPEAHDAAELGFGVCLGGGAGGRRRVGQEIGLVSGVGVCTVSINCACLIEARD